MPNASYCAADRAQGAQAGGDDALQARKGVEFTRIVGGGQSRLDAGEVGVGHIGHAQAFQLGFDGATCHHRLHRAGQGLQFGHAVDVCGCLGIEHVTQQA